MQTKSTCVNECCQLLNNNFSVTFGSTGSILIGLQSLTSRQSPDLKVGVITAHFQSSGKELCFIDKLIKRVMRGKMS